MKAGSSPDLGGTLTQERVRRNPAYRPFFAGLCEIRLGAFRAAPVLIKADSSPDLSVNISRYELGQGRQRKISTHPLTATRPLLIQFQQLRQPVREGLVDRTLGLVAVEWLRVPDPGWLPRSMQQYYKRAIVLAPPSTTRVAGTRGTSPAGQLRDYTDRSIVSSRRQAGSSLTLVESSGEIERESRSGTRLLENSSFIESFPTTPLLADRTKTLGIVFLFRKGS